MAFLHEEEDDHNTTKSMVQRSSKPQKAHLTGEFVIMAKFGCHALHHVASRFANVIRQGGREAN